MANDHKDIRIGHPGLPVVSPSSTTMKPARHVHLWEIVAVRELCIVAMGVFLLWLCFQLQAILVPVLIGLGLAYLTDPALDYVEQTWKLPRWLAVTFMALVICALVSGFVLWVGPRLADQLRSFIEKFPTYLSLLADRHGMDVKEITRNFKEISGKDFANVVLSLPPLAEQSRIVTRVEALMRLCDALEAKGLLRMDYKFDSTGARVLMNAGLSIQPAMLRPSSGWKS